ncbi:concanavalin A-like lectin/glucanase domain-containing protein [Cladorrhinum sp. PSN332]|nr:concanavalin A-like lectin/glucanase domain-containing protein [Cladorrhinum sp. PSN332]
MKTLQKMALLLLLPKGKAEANPLVDDSKCGCYITNSTNNTHHFFTEHRFFDFRSLPKHANVPQPLNDYSSSPSAPLTSAYFNATPFADFWMVSNWNNAANQRSDATVNMTNSPNNVYIESSDPSSSKSSTFLTLRTQRLPTFQTSSEIESTSAKFRHLSIRTLARTVGSPGAITALFTYRHSPNPALVQESDLEIRTSDPAQNLIHYTNQPSLNSEGNVEARATRNATMPQNLKWTDWAVHRLDWTPNYTAWYINDVLVAQIAFQVPKDESNIILNAWSDGGEWTGNMTVGDAAYLQLQWIEVVYNSTEVEGATKVKTSSSKAKKEGNEGGICGAVCAIDGTSQLGKPIMLWGAGGRVRGNGLLSLSVVVAMVIFLLM